MSRSSIAARMSDVGSLADIDGRNRDVRFSPKSRHPSRLMLGDERFQFPAYKKAGALLNTRHEVSNGGPVPIAAPRRSDTAPIECRGNFAQGISSGLPERIEHGDQVCRKLVRCLHLCSASQGACYTKICRVAQP